MGFRDLLVYVDDSSQCRARLDIARSLAVDHGARLTGLAVAELMMVPEYVPMQAIEEQRRTARERNERLRETFESATAGEGITTEWRATDSIDSGANVLDVVALHARYSDLAIVGQIDPDDVRALVPQDLPGQLALISGRPVLALPYAWRPQPVGRRVMIAWNAGRESARAVADAMPLLERAEAVRVVAFTKSGGVHGHGDVPGADIAAHLARHGVKVESEHSVVPDIRVGEAMLSAAADYGADLLVMGAYGRARMREMILGGTTREIMRNMTLPVLVSH